MCVDSSAGDAIAKGPRLRTKQHLCLKALIVQGGFHMMEVSVGWVSSHCVPMRQGTDSFPS